MFTGIIEALGEITDKQAKGGDCRLQLTSAGLDFSDVSLGDSIATNGVCLTVVEKGEGYFWADVSNETLAMSTLAALPVGSKVNLEKALLAGGRFGGHIVTGHVDGMGVIASLQNDGRSVRIEVKAPVELKKYIAHKGSITVDGVSLTVNALTVDGFSLNIVPHTANETIISSYREGDQVNLEIDVLARYIEQMMKSEQPASSKIDKAFLAEHGFYKSR